MIGDVVINGILNAPTFEPVFQKVYFLLLHNTSTQLGKKLSEGEGHDRQVSSLPSKRGVDDLDDEDGEILQLQLETLKIRLKLRRLQMKLKGAT